MGKGKSKSNLNWKQIVIPVVITAIATLVVSIAAPLVLDYFKTPEYKLQYYTQDTLPFKTQTTEMASYQVTIKNEGTKVAENIVCRVFINGATVDQNAFLSDYPLTYNQTVTGDTLVLTVDNMNPQESGTIYLLANSQHELPKQPEVQVRAIGILGVKASLTDSQDSFSWELILSIASVVGFVGILSSRLVFRKTEKNEDFDDLRQNECLGYLCGIHDLSTEAKRYYDTSIHVFYRSESDRLTTIAVENQSDRKKILNMLIDLLKYRNDISDDSKAIINFNIAKILKVDGKDAGSKDYLEKAKRLAPKIVGARLKIDPTFKVP